MDSFELIKKYFPNLSEQQHDMFGQLGELYEYWNERINVISRKDIDNFYEHHVLHSLAIAKFLTPTAGTSFLDMGTGGGFPGIPLAIMWPECRFHLIDRVGKKIRVGQAVAEAIGLKNVTFQHGDIGECRVRYDFVVSRAVMRLEELVPLIRKNISERSHNGVPNGLLCLKGGDLEAEIAAVKKPVLDVPLSDYFYELFFSTKSLIYVKL